MSNGQLSIEQLSEALQISEDNLELFQERMADLEAELSLRADDLGWRKLQADGREFNHEARRTIREVARVMGIKNPLIKRGLHTQANYVWGQGVNIQAKPQDVFNGIIQAFIDEPANQAELFGHQARLGKDRELATDGDVFLVLFTDQRTGTVRVRSIVADEVVDIITNPQDRKQPWYYKREYDETTLDAVTGQTVTKRHIAYYPDWRYSPRNKPQRIGGKDVHWDAPVYHIKAGGYSDWKFGLSEVYAAIDWAKAYKEFLEDWATLSKAYSRWAHKVTTKGDKKRVAGVTRQLAPQANGHERSADRAYDPTQPPRAGATAVLAEGMDIDPVRIGGANVSANDGRRLLLMVAAAYGFPETFFGDVSVGTLATAKSLDRPTELGMQARQWLWMDVYLDLFDYVLRWKVKTGALQGVGAVVADGDSERVVWRTANGTSQEPTLAVTFPPIVEPDVSSHLSAIDTASKHIPDRQMIAKLVLEALGLQDVDEVLAAMLKQGLLEQPAAPESVESDVL